MATLTAYLLLLIVASAAPGPLALTGGEVRALAFHPADPGRILAGTASGQIYHSEDAGASWRFAGVPVPFPGYAVNELVWDGDRVWAALEGVYGGGTVALSEDGGTNWTGRHQGLPSTPVYSIAVDPTRPGHLYAGTLGGVVASEDEGRTWRDVSRGIAGLHSVASLWIDPRRPATILAGTFRRAYRSDDAGATWRGAFEGMELDSEVFSLVGVPGSPDEVWAATCGWVYRSGDRGGSWVRHREGLDDRRTPSFLALAGGRLLAGTTGGLFSSDDGGQTWMRRTPRDLVVEAIAQHPARPSRILIGTEGAGVWASDDGGDHFFPSTDGISGLRVSAMIESRGELFVAVRDAGPVSGIHVSRDGGRTFTHDADDLPNVLAMGVVDGGPYALTERGIFARRQRSWVAVPGLPAERFTGLAAAGEQLAVLTGRRVLERRDGGWREVPLGTQRPLAIAFLGAALVVSTDVAVWRFAGGERSPLAVPFTGGTALPFGSETAYVGKEGCWVERDGSWKQATAGPGRAIVTAAAGCPLVVLDGAKVACIDAKGRSTELPVPLPALDISAVLATGDGLLVATTGYGIWSVPLPAEVTTRILPSEPSRRTRP